jgi:hypothetical protein
MQGALFGARSLGTGFGPILFATVFSMFSRTDSTLPFFPGKRSAVLSYVNTDKHCLHCCPMQAAFFASAALLWYVVGIFLALHLKYKLRKVRPRV